MRKYPNDPWKEDKIKCVVVMKIYDKKGERIKKSILKVFVTKEVNRELPSKVIEETLSTKERFKYNLSPDTKMTIPRRVFKQLLQNPDIDNYFTTPTRGRDNLIAYDERTKIKKEKWFDPDNTSCVLYFKDGLLLHYKKGK